MKDVTPDPVPETDSEKQLTVSKELLVSNDNDIQYVKQELHEAVARFQTGHRKRLREEVFSNLRTAPEYKLLELLLTFVLPRKDTRPLAHALLERFGSIRMVLDASAEDLLSIPGLGKKTTELWDLFRELQARYVECPIVQGETLATVHNVVKMARARLGNAKIEMLWVAYVDTRLHLISWVPFAQGTLNAALFFPQEVIREALRLHAWGIILVHNHPGGSGASAQDIDITRRMDEAARATDLCLLEHIILINDDYIGLREEGILPPL